VLAILWYQSVRLPIEHRFRTLVEGVHHTELGGAVDPKFGADVLVSLWLCPSIIRPMIIVTSRVTVLHNGRT
jgi:hypothetical protein